MASSLEVFQEILKIMNKQNIGKKTYLLLWQLITIKTTSH